MNTYKAIKLESGQTVLEGINVGVSLATFSGASIQAASIYKPSDRAATAVKQGHCAPVNSVFIKDVLIDFSAAN